MIMSNHTNANYCKLQCENFKLEINESQYENSSIRECPVYVLPVRNNDCTVNIFLSERL